MPNKTKNEKRKKEKYIVESVISSPTSASGDGSSSSHIFAIPDEDSVRLGPYPITASLTFDNHPVNGEFLGHRILHGYMGSDSKFVQLLGVLIMLSNRLFDVPFALHSSIIFALLPSRIE